MKKEFRDDTDRREVDYNDFDWSEAGEFDEEGHPYYLLERAERMAHNLETQPKPLMGVVGLIRDLAKEIKELRKK